MNRNVTIGLLLVFALLLLYVLLVQVPQDQTKAAQTPTPFATSGGYLWQITNEQIAGVHLTDRAQSRDLALAQNADGTWLVAVPENRPADTTQMSTALYQLAGLYVSSEITTVTDLAPFGVLSPTYTIEVSLTDGRILKAAVGNLTPLGSSYYVMREGESIMLVVNKASIDSLMGLINTPPYALATPTPTAAFVVPNPAQP